MAEVNNLNDTYQLMEQSRAMEAAKTPDQKRIEAEKMATGELPQAPGYEPVKTSDETNKYRKHFWQVWRPAAPKENPLSNKTIPEPTPIASPLDRGSTPSAPPATKAA